MPERSLLINGPPGAGKTRQLNRLAIATATQFSPEHLAAVTFTRAAASELRARIGTALHIPPEQQRKRIPRVGTIHALAWQLLGRPPVVSDSGRSFCQDLNIPPEKWQRDIGRARDLQYEPSPDEIDAMPGADPFAPDMSAVRLALAVWDGLRHRYPYEPPLAHLSELLPHTLPAGESYDSMSDLIVRYEEWKREKGLVDYADMLTEGRLHPLPARVLLADECQDNSPLLWSVIDAWAKQVHTLVCAGDVFQSIYIFSGASPLLFRDREGTWLKIPEAHRFSNEHADYAKSILRQGGWDSDKDESFHSSWRGVGDSPSDGTTFYLARTHALLIPFREQLLSQGTPFGELRGRGPLQTKEAQAWRIAQKWTAQEPISATDLYTFADAMPPRTLAYGVRASLKKLADLPGLQFSPEEARQKLGNFTPAYLADRLQHADYYRRVQEQHGSAALSDPPKTLLGSIHGAKGKEADEVHLVRSWGMLPARNMRRAPHEEALVAYVGASRHRKELVLEDADSGQPYDFP